LPRAHACQELCRTRTLFKFTPQTAWVVHGHSFGCNIQCTATLIKVYRGRYKYWRCWLASRMLFRLNVEFCTNVEENHSQLRNTHSHSTGYELSCYWYTAAKCVKCRKCHPECTKTDHTPCPPQPRTVHI